MRIKNAQKVSVGRGGNKGLTKNAVGNGEGPYFRTNTGLVAYNGGSLVYEQIPASSPTIHPGTPRTISNSLVMLSGSSIWRNGRRWTMQELCGKSEIWSGVSAQLVSPETNLLAGTAMNVESGKLRAVLLVPVDIAVDANRDGFIKFAGNHDSPEVFGKSKDKTEQNKPFRFWVNNDNDGTIASEADTVPALVPDYLDGIIKSRRDLEDFVRLQVHIGVLHETLESGEIKLAFEWRNTGGTAPKVKLYRAKDAGTGYLEDSSTALAMTIAPFCNTLGEVSAGTPFFLPEGFWTRTSPYSNVPATLPSAWFLFEGSSEGKGQLVLTLWKGERRIGEGAGVWLELMDIRKMYERARSSPVDGFDAPYDYMTTPPEPNVGYNIYAGDGYLFQRSPDEEKTAVVFVHGWNVTWDSYHSSSETMFKRLWHKGYKGRFCAFRWPTLAGFPMEHYNTSEYRAWKYGFALKAYVDSLPNDYTVNIAAHSMGNVVAGSALKSGMSISNYAMMQAAIPAGCYDASAGVNNYERFTNAEVLNPTPDDASDLGCRGYLAGVSGRLVNFYNVDDFTLTDGTLPVLGEVSWEKNQVTYKPDANATLHGNRIYDYDAGTPANPYPMGQRCFLRGIYPPFNQRMVTDIHESMSFVARPRSKAVGATSSVGTPIDIGPGSASDLGDTLSDHSGQFNRRIQEVQPFYDSLYDLVR